MNRLLQPPHPLVEQLARRLSQNFGLTSDVAVLVVDDVFDALDQTVDDYIADRHHQLQQAGLKNDAIYRRLSDELATWRFKAPELTRRQIRRRVYG